MASITIRKLDDEVTARLRVRAAGNGRSLEEEARVILCEAVGPKLKPQNLAGVFRARFGPENSVELELPSRESVREPPCFD